MPKTNVDMAYDLMEKVMEAMQVVGPDGLTYLIPVKAKDDWDAWLDLAGERWVRPNYARSVDSLAFVTT